MNLNTHLIRISEGVLRGQEVISPYTKQKYYSFQGIRYGKPPIASLRFQPPEPVEPWEGVYDALKEGNICPQKNVILKRCFQSEDCLFLNVYTPSLSRSTGNNNILTRKLPVMFWIHGGANIMGTGNSILHGPDYLIQHEIILVTINYRLGIFGFLSLDSDVLPGNMALKDQILALRWVQSNIEAFDGDPNNVTVFGESSGGNAAHILSIVPAARGLFHKIIVHSGSALLKWAVGRNMRQIALNIARQFGCYSTNDKDILECFLKIPTKDLLNIIKSDTHDDFRYLNNFWKITIEPPNPTAVLTEDPEILFEDGRFIRMPCIFGVCSAEGLMFNKAFHYEENLENELNKEFNGIYCNNPFINVKLEPEKLKRINQMIRKFYFNNEPITKQNRWKFAKLFGEYNMTYDTIKSAQYHSKFNDHPVYLSCFNFTGKLDIYRKNFIIDGKEIGAGHTDELAYVFPFQVLKRRAAKDSPEEDMIYKMTTLWTNFAKTSNPNSPKTERLIKWKPMTKDHQYYLHIDKNSTLKENLFKDEVQFWDTIYEYLKKPKSKI